MHLGRLEFESYLNHIPVMTLRKLLVSFCFLNIQNSLTLITEVLVSFKIHQCLSYLEIYIPEADFLPGLEVQMFRLDAST
jgi:hypothetical protein